MEKNQAVFQDRLFFVTVICSQQKQRAAARAVRRKGITIYG